MTTLQLSRTVDTICSRDWEYRRLKRNGQLNVCNVIRAFVMSLLKTCGLAVLAGFALNFLVMGPFVMLVDAGALALAVMQDRAVVFNSRFDAWAGLAVISMVVWSVVLCGLTVIACYVCRKMYLERRPPKPSKREPAKAIRKVIGVASLAGNYVTSKLDRFCLTVSSEVALPYAEELRDRIGQATYDHTIVLRTATLAEFNAEIDKTRSALVRAQYEFGR